MKRKTAIAIILFFLLAAGAVITFVLSRPSVDKMAKKLVKSHPGAVVKNIDASTSVAKPMKIRLVNIGSDSVLLFEFKDKASAEYGALVQSEGIAGERFSIYTKGKVMVEYFGASEEFSKELVDLLHVKEVFQQ